MKLIEAFKCEYCGKMYQRKHNCIRHEKYCSKNPVNFKACEGCKFLKEIQVEIERGDNYYSGEPENSFSKAFLCTKLNIKLYPTLVERKGYLKRYPWTFADQLPMPKECKHFELNLNWDA